MGTNFGTSSIPVHTATQVLLVVAEELGKFVPYVGGSAYAHTLLIPLEVLSAVEETVVREKAVESLNLVAAELPEASIAELFAPLVKVHSRRAHIPCPPHDAIAAVARGNRQTSRPQNFKPGIYRFNG